MKTNAIIRIILFSLAIFLLLGVLGMGLGITAYLGYFSGETHQNAIQNSDEIQLNSFSAMDGMETCTADPTKIRKIEIEWAAGSITIEPAEDTAEIRIGESPVDKEKYKMVCRQSGDKLTIQFCGGSMKFPSFGLNCSSKDLYIQVPSGWFCDTLEIDSASADVKILDMGIGELDFDGASGNCTLENCTVSQLNVDAASGDLNFSGVLDVLDFDGASADCTLVLSNCPRHIDLDGMSGKLDITLPSDCGFTANTNGLSCDFSTDFVTTVRNGSHCHGDGSCRIELEALSGSVSIHDGGYNCRDTGHDHHTAHH